MQNMIRDRWRFVALCCAALVTLVVAAPWRSSADEGQNASPRSGSVGQRFVFYATGFRSGESVGFWATAPDGSVQHQDNPQIEASDDGRADWSWTAPANAQPGTWLIVAQGVDSNTLRTLRVDVVATGAPQPSSPPPAAEEGQNASPRSGGAGQRFAFYATGFRPGERVGFWATAPDGRVLSQPDRQVVANPSGRADWKWTAPADAQPGTWLIVAQGVNSDSLRTLRVEIVR